MRVELPHVESQITTSVAIHIKRPIGRCSARGPAIRDFGVVQMRQFLFPDILNDAV